jgi:hypothetical protein
MIGITLLNQSRRFTILPMPPLDSPITKDDLWKTLTTTRNAITEAFDRKYADEISELVEDLAYSYKLLSRVLNSEQQHKIPDNQHQALVLCWTGLNTLLAALDLYRGGYMREPQMLIRDALEIFAAAYDIFVNESRYELLKAGSKDFNSADSIKEVKKLHPIVAQFYGLLSQHFTHVSTLHLLPHKSSTPLVIGGLYDHQEQQIAGQNLLMMMSSVETCNMILELLVAPYIRPLRFWIETDEKDTYKYVPGGKRGRILLERMQKYVTDSE